MRLRRLLRRRRQASPPPPVVTIDAALTEVPDTLRGDLDEVVLHVEGLSALLALQASVPGRVAVRRVKLVVSPWPRPNGRLARRLGYLPHLVRHDVRSTGGALTVFVRLGHPTDLGDVLAAVLPLVTPVPRAPQPGRDDVALLLPDAAGAPFLTTVDRSVRVAELGNETVRPADVLVVGDAEHETPDGTRSSLIRLSDRPDLDVDPAVHRPIGRSDLDGPVGEGRFVGDLEVVLPDGTLRGLTNRFGLTDLGVAALLPLAGVSFDRSPADGAERRVLRQLSASGVVVSAPGGGRSDLERLWDAALPADADGLERASIAQRRTAHRDHSTAWLVGGAPSVSIVLPSRRPDHLEQALADVAAMRYPQMQLVIGLHGTPRPAGLDEWLAPVRERADVVVLERAAEVPFGTLLVDLSSRADGDLVTKVDDDDRYCPDHLWDLVVAHRYSGAAFVGKGAEHVYLQARDTTLRRRARRPEQYGDFVAGGTLMFTTSDLVALGGWRPVSRSVDRALLDRALRAGAGVYCTHGFGYLYVRRDDEHHTWVTTEEYLTRNVLSTRDGLVLPDGRS